MKKQIIPSTAIVFNDKQEILLAQRHYADDPTNRYHGAWGFPGGGIEVDEQPIDAAVRETFEETGLRIEVLSKRPIVMSTIEVSGLQVIKLGYISKYTSGEIDTGKDSGTNDAKWFSLDEINELNTTLLTKEMTQNAFEIFNKELEEKK
jgi:8-oxo-dGTP diphosphatase